MKVKRMIKSSSEDAPEFNVGEVFEEGDGISDEIINNGMQDQEYCEFERFGYKYSCEAYGEQDEDGNYHEWEVKEVKPIRSSRRPLKSGAPRNRIRGKEAADRDRKNDLWNQNLSARQLKSICEREGFEYDSENDYYYNLFDDAVYIEAHAARGSRPDPYVIITWRKYVNGVNDWAVDLVSQKATQYDMKPHYDATGSQPDGYYLEGARAANVLPKLIDDVRKAVKSYDLTKNMGENEYHDWKKNGHRRSIKDDSAFKYVANNSNVSGMHFADEETEEEWLSACSELADLAQEGDAVDVYTIAKNMRRSLHEYLSRGDLTYDEDAELPPLLDAIVDGELQLTKLTGVNQSRKPVKSSLVVQDQDVRFYRRFSSGFKGLFDPRRGKEVWDDKVGHDESVQFLDQIRIDDDDSLADLKESLRPFSEMQPEVSFLRNNELQLTWKTSTGNIGKYTVRFDVEKGEIVSGFDRNSANLGKLL